MRPRGVQPLADFVGVGVGFSTKLDCPLPRPSFAGEPDGVDCLNGEGEAGDSGLRNGELRGEPYPNGEGLYATGIACEILSIRSS
jgi:hypothetical protein